MNNIITISYYSCPRLNILRTLLTFWPPLCTSLLHVLSFMSRTSVQRISAVFAAFGFYELESMFPGTRQHKCGGGGGVHTKISRPTASLKEGQYFTSHCLPVPILPCHTACFSQFVWRWGSVLAQSGPLRSPMKICCILLYFSGSS